MTDLIPAEATLAKQGRVAEERAPGRLFALKEYPREVMCLYAQGFSMCDYLVKRSDRKTFLAFVGRLRSLAAGRW